MKTKRDIFIGGAWPYANYFMHVGHLAALLPGDIIARYYRLCDDNVVYVSGSDTHGTPITERAKQEGKKPEEIASFYHEEFVKTFDKMGFKYDEYTSTMTEYHSSVVQEYFKILYDNGYLIPKEEPQDYCENCSKFLSDREIIGICPHCGGKSTGEQCDSCLASLDSKEVLDKHCKTCGHKCIMKNNKHLYFDLPQFAPILKELAIKNKDSWRKMAVGETEKYLNMGLIERAATRQLDWGIPVPVNGYEDKRIYVWIEAVMGYLSAGKEFLENKGEDFDKFFSNDNKNLTTYYVHGKDNISFHTIIFPALVAGLNKNYRLPDKIISSAYVNLDNEKMSKSKGNLITVNELLEMFDKDTLRYYFISNGPEQKDTNCSIDEIVQVHNKFLVGTLGNFINRNLSFMIKKFEGNIKEASINQDIRTLTEETYKKAGILIENGELKSALNLIMEYVARGNKYYDENEPWIKVKEDINDFNDITYTCIFMIINIANLLAPFIPDTSKKIKDILKINTPLAWEIENLTGDLKIETAPLLFQRIDEIKK